MNLLQQQAQLHVAQRDARTPMAASRMGTRRLLALPLKSTRKNLMQLVKNKSKKNIKLKTLLLWLPERLLLRLFHVLFHSRRFSLHLLFSIFSSLRWTNKNWPSLILGCNSGCCNNVGGRLHSVFVSPGKMQFISSVIAHGRVVTIFICKTFWCQLWGNVNVLFVAYWVSKKQNESWKNGSCFAFAPKESWLNNNK